MRISRRYLGTGRLTRDYEDFLRQRGLVIWDRANPLRQELVNKRCQTADEVAKWVREMVGGGQDGRDKLQNRNFVTGFWILNSGT